MGGCPAAGADGLVADPESVHPQIAAALALDPDAVAPVVAGAVPVPVAGLPDLLGFHHRGLWPAFGAQGRESGAGGVLLDGLAAGGEHADGQEGCEGG